MKFGGQIAAEFIEWIDRSLDGTITSEQFTQLDEEIATNKIACELYLEFITTYVSLSDQEGFLPNPQDLANDNLMMDIEALSCATDSPAFMAHKQSLLKFEPYVSEDEKRRMIEVYAREQLRVFLEKEHENQVELTKNKPGWDMFEAVKRATEALLCVFKVGVRVAKAGTISFMAVVIVSILALWAYSNRTLGILVETVDAQWENPIDSKGRLRPRSITLEQGYARIRLNKGSELILQAPSTIALQTSNSIFLENGWITARVPKDAVGFTVHTSESTVVDFGTEFGLLADTENSLEMHVFNGAVGLQFREAIPSAQNLQTFNQGEAATMDGFGHIERAAMKDRSHLFVRSMPKELGLGIPGKRLSLADMIGGGNGLNTGELGHGIDPGSGTCTMDRKVYKAESQGFISIPSLLFVDGVFVPDANQGYTTISSTGTLFEECPKTSGKYFESINNIASFQATGHERHLGRLDARTYGTKTEPSISIHPNAGITFDLGKIRSCMPETEITRFTARCGISETVRQYFDRDWDVSKIEVDIWVLVDGKVRFTKTMSASSPQSAEIDISLGTKDRFLTLATTAPGSHLYCWSLFAKPALELAVEKETAMNQ